MMSMRQMSLKRKDFMDDVIHVHRARLAFINNWQVLDRDRASLSGPCIEVVLNPRLMNPDVRQRLHDETVRLDLMNVISIFIPEASLIHLHDDVALPSPTGPDGLDDIICLVRSHSAT